VAQGLAPDPSIVKPQALDYQEYYNYVSAITMDADFVRCASSSGQVYMLVILHHPRQRPMSPPNTPSSLPPAPPNTPEPEENMDDWQVLLCFPVFLLGPEQHP
jgi:hypothetical protein